MAEPALDLSEIMDLYKEDARRMAGLMQAALQRWEEVQAGRSPPGRSCGNYRISCGGPAGLMDFAR